MRNDGQKSARPIAQPVFDCPLCGSPVADSKEGTEAHARRKPECRWVMLGETR